MRAPLEVGILGAGAIGTALGLELSAAGVPVTLVRRSRFGFEADALSLRGIDGRVYRGGRGLSLSNDPTSLSDVDLCLVTVKSKDTLAAGEGLRSVLRPDAVVVSFQNGLRNPDRLRESLPSERVIPGMVTFNVVHAGPTELRQTTSGPLVVGDAPGEIGARLRALKDAFATSERFVLSPHIVDVQAGKLLLNLNNAVCAATGVTILESIRSRPLRRAFASLILEGHRVLRAAGMRPRAIVGLPPAVIARVLPLPNAVVLRVARKMVAIDPEARSSTLQDLLAGRLTEIDDLSGEIVHRAARAGTTAPLNRAITEIVHGLEGQAEPLPFVAPDELEALLRRGP